MSRPVRKSVNLSKSGLSGFWTVPSNNFVYQNLTKSLQDQTCLMTKITNFLRTFVMSRATGLSNVYFVANLAILDIT